MSQARSHHLEQTANHQTEESKSYFYPHSSDAPLFFTGSEFLICITFLLSELLTTFLARRVYCQ